MKIDGKLPIAKFAADLPGAMAVFESLGIDYACAGDRSLDDAAHAEGIAPEVVIASLRRLKAVDQAESWSDRPLADLTHYLVEQHHRFVREELAWIAIRLADLCSTPRTVPPDLLSLRAAFARLSEIVLPHLHREEERVFRALEALEKSWQSNQPLTGIHGDLIATLRQLADEHGAIDAQLRTMRELSEPRCAWRISLLCPAQLPRNAHSSGCGVDGLPRVSRVVELPEARIGAPLVHRKHRIPSRPSPQLADPVLPAAGCDGRNPRVAASDRHELEAARDRRLFPRKPVGRGERSHDRLPRGGRASRLTRLTRTVCSGRDASS